MLNRRTLLVHARSHLPHFPALPRQPSLSPLCAFTRLLSHTSAHAILYTPTHSAGTVLPPSAWTAKSLSQLPRTPPAAPSATSSRRHLKPTPQSPSLTASKSASPEHSKSTRQISPPAASKNTSPKHPKTRSQHSPPTSKTTFPKHPKTRSQHSLPTSKNTSPKYPKTKAQRPQSSPPKSASPKHPKTKSRNSPPAASKSASLKHSQIQLQPVSFRSAIPKRRKTATLPDPPAILKPPPLASASASTPPTICIPPIIRFHLSGPPQSASKAPRPLKASSKADSCLKNSMFVRVETLRGWPKNTTRFTKADYHVLGHFFDGDGFFERSWDIYHYETASRDFFLLPIAQVKCFLEHVHEQTDFEKNIRNVPDKLLSFHMDSTAAYPPPVLIGTISSKEEYDKIVEELAWSEIERAERSKAEKAKRAQKRKEKQLVSMMSYTASVRAARQHLGFGMKACPAKEVPQEMVPLNCEGPVLVAIDVEAWEMDHNRVTEIGISILDTMKIPPPSELPTLSVADLDLGNLDYDKPAPKTRASTLCDLIQTRHLRILEHKFMRNGTYVSDAADKFDFGKSEWVSLKDVPSILGSALRFYDATGNKRKIIVVGHDVKQDFSYLRITGYDLWNIKDLEVIDTTSMYKAVFDVHDSRSLSKVLMDLGVVFWNLHNAGNDAAYTLQAFVHLADKGAPAHVPSSSPIQEEIPKPLYPDYEDMVESGCITYHDPGKHQLGPRPPSNKKGGKSKRGNKGQYGNQKPTMPTASAFEMQQPVDLDWGSHSAEADAGW